MCSFSIWYVFGFKIFSYPTYLIVIVANTSSIGHVVHALNDTNVENYDENKIKAIHNNFNSDHQQNVLSVDDDSEHNDFFLETSTLSMSPLQSLASSNDQQGAQYLEKFLLDNYESGIVASLFNKRVYEDIDKLQHLLSLHGIANGGMSNHDCRVLLFRHIFSGQCVSSRCSSHDRTACMSFSKRFKSATEMSSTAFQIMSTATADQRSNDDFLHNRIKIR